MGKWVKINFIVAKATVETCCRYVDDSIDLTIEMFNGDVTAQKADVLIYPSNKALLLNGLKFNKKINYFILVYSF